MDLTFTASNSLQKEISDLVKVIHCFNLFILTQTIKSLFKLYSLTLICCYQYSTFVVHCGTANQ